VDALHPPGSAEKAAQVLAILRAITHDHSPLIRQASLTRKYIFQLLRFLHNEKFNHKDYAADIADTDSSRHMS
jgi:hypothetical protein